VDYSEYRDLAPISNIENGEEYLKALKWAFNNRKVKNIALAGPYGAGKSSIIETYLENNQKQKDEPLLKYLKISMATFIEGHAVSNDGKIAISAEEVEEGILKQLFYKVDHKKIPQSRYRKLHAVTFSQIVVKMCIAFLIVLFFSLIFYPKFCEMAWEKILDFVSTYNLPPFTAIIVGAIMVLLVVLIISYLWRTIVSKYHVKEIKLPTDTTIQKEDDYGNSVFNKNLDEIMYFFESTHYRVVFFEDLDRLDDKKIFVHLRGLNNLLNNADSIKNKPIVFVYAVKDDIFTKEDRTKFFDFIIPVIPVINSTNSGEILLERLDEAKRNGISHDITQGFVLDVAPFISDMRILQNIYNEFIIYKNTLRTGQELSLSDEQMMAIMVFKNLNPSAFADIQSEKGIIKQAFIDKNRFIVEKKNILQNKIDHYEEVIETVSGDILKSIRELKFAMLVSLAKGKGVVRYLDQNPYSGKRYEANQILRDDFDLRELTDNRFIAQCISFTTSGYSEQVEKNILESYVHRWEAIREYHDKSLQGLQEEREVLKRKQHGLSGKSLEWLLLNNSSDEVLSEEVKMNKFLVFLLRRGYIDEQYVNYINYFKGNSITNADMNFIISVKNQEPKSFDYELIKVEMVIKRLQEYEFEQKAIYNFQLLDQLLEDREESDKLELFAKQLSDETNVSWQFIDEFVEITVHLSEFIKILSQQWQGMWNYIIELPTLTYERQIHYLRLILKNLEIDQLLQMNKNNCVTTFLQEHDDILRQLEDVETEKMCKIITGLNIMFEHVNTNNVSEELLDYIFEHKNYVLNRHMVMSVVQHKNVALIEMLSKQPYSTVVKLGYSPLLQYVRENIQDYIKKVILVENNIADDSTDIVDLLQSILSESDLCIRLIEQEQFTVETFSECLIGDLENNKDEVKLIWRTLLAENKVIATWENVLLYWKNVGLNDYLKAFIENNVEDLVNSEKKGIEDSFIGEFLQADFSMDLLRRLLPQLPMKDFDFMPGEFSEDVLGIMVDCNYFVFTVEYYQNIASVYPNIAIEYIIQNQSPFIMMLDEFIMTKELLEELLFDQRIDEKVKTILFERYAESCMTSKIAENMNLLGFHVTKEIFNVAWSCLAKKEKEKLMFDNIELLDVTSSENCFSELGGKYSRLADRSRRHEVELDMSTQNEKLVNHLVTIEYITSWNYKEKKVYDAVSESNQYIKVIKCKVKLKK